jgi:hypothetical protein
MTPHYQQTLYMLPDKEGKKTKMTPLAMLPDKGQKELVGGGR